MPTSSGSGSIKRYFGEDALSRRSILTLTLPISAQEESTITDWDEMVELWRAIYTKHLGLTPSAAPLLLATNQASTQASKLTEVAFESLAVPAFYTISPQVRF